MELYVFDRDLNFIGINDSFTSLIWRRKYFKGGDFELNCSLTNKNLMLFARGNIIYKKDNEAGYIEYRNMKQDTEGKEILVIKGKFLTGYFNRRIIWGTKILNTTSEVAMRTLVSDNCISPSDTTRVIPNVMLGTLQGYTDTVDYQVSYANLSDELENLSNISNLGHRINLDITNKKLIFDVYKGLDHSVNQAINPRCIFSKEFENILEQEYVDSLNNYKNTCLVAGVGEGAARKTITINPNNIGLDRHEIFADQKSLSNEIDSVLMSDTDYNLLLTGKGNELLATTLEIQTFDSKVNLNSNLKYHIDYDLGDIVTVVNNPWGVVISPRITDITEIYEEQGMSIEITFGSSIPTLITKIKQLIK